ncbi:MAG: hypothetical protein J6P83_03640 [Bacteroidales bacterium]|nr:hypothetical protein [Bacteroidales bacterium]
MRKSHPNKGDILNAGKFLQDELAKSGHDVAWLAEQTGKEQAFLEELFKQSNMDAELFVRMGLPLGDPFFASLHALIFQTPAEAAEMGT